MGLISVSNTVVMRYYIVCANDVKWCKPKIIKNESVFVRESMSDHHKKKKNFSAQKESQSEIDNLPCLLYNVLRN